VAARSTRAASREAADDRDSADIVRRSASYVDRILKGEKPSELPVQAPVKFELADSSKLRNAVAIADSCTAANGIAARLFKGRDIQPEVLRTTYARGEFASLWHDLDRTSSGPDAVGTRVTSRPPHKAVRAAFPHTAPTSGPNGKELPSGIARRRAFGNTSARRYRDRGGSHGVCAQPRCGSVLPDRPRRVDARTRCVACARLSQGSCPCKQGMIPCFSRAVCDRFTLGGGGQTPMEIRKSHVSFRQLRTSRRIGSVPPCASCGLMRCSKRGRVCTIIRSLRQQGRAASGEY
jgi:hypothetical protein